MRNFVEEFKKKKLYLSIAGVIAFIAMLICTKLPYNNILIFVPITGYIAFAVKIWRCPNCNLYLGKARNLKNCKGCGEKLV